MCRTKQPSVPAYAGAYAGAGSCNKKHLKTRLQVKKVTNKISVALFICSTF